MTKAEIKTIARECGFPRDEETLAVWFLHLYGRDFDHDPDGHHTGKDTASNHTLATAVRSALR